ncbi:MAG: hypothetical protein H7Y11_09360, partial [Armatimonadetes bacterium]|nr:hypothetical protein [Anaerolineae bacterium]
MKLRLLLATMLVVLMVSGVAAQDGEIALGDVVEGNLRTNGSTDEYVFEGEAGTLVQISVESD